MTLRLVSTCGRRIVVPGTYATTPLLVEAALHGGKKHLGLAAKGVPAAQYAYARMLYPQLPAPAAPPRFAARATSSRRRSASTSVAPLLAREVTSLFGRALKQPMRVELSKIDFVRVAAGRDADIDEAAAALALWSAKRSAGWGPAATLRLVNQDSVPASPPAWLRHLPQLCGVYAWATAPAEGPIFFTPGQTADVATSLADPDIHSGFAEYIAVRGTTQAAALAVGGHTPDAAAALMKQGLAEAEHYWGAIHGAFAAAAADHAGIILEP